MILFISNSGESLPIAWRVQREGQEAKVYLHNPDYRKNYDGMLEKVPAKKILGTAKKADAVIFDITRVNEFKPYDRELLKLFRAKGGTVFGPVAEVLRKHSRVIGCSTWTEELEMDRTYSTKIAREIGLEIPETHDFSSLKDGLKFLKVTKDRWVFKPHDNLDLDMTYVEKYPGELATKIEGEYAKRLEKDNIDFMLQKVVEGIEISTEGWFDGEKWTTFNHTIEDKRLMSDGLGPSIGSQGNTVWVKRDPNGLLAGNLKKLTSRLKKCRYIGPVDINCIVADGKPYFLEFSPRFGYDAIYCLLTLLKGRITDFFLNGFSSKFHDGFASSQRITIPPFPYADEALLSDMAKDVAIEGMPGNYPDFWMEDVYAREGKLFCAGADGILGVCCGYGATISESVNRMYRSIKKLKISSYLQYRSDGGKRARKATQELGEQGLSIW
jgi:phosphoribosylamine-glycine ligase